MSKNRVIVALVCSASLLALGGCFKKPEPPKEPEIDVASSVASDAAAVVQSLPAREVGLWQTSISEEGSEETPQTIEICIDAEVDKRLGVLGSDLSGDICKKTVNRLPDGNWDILAECQMGTGGKNEFSGSISGDYSKDYTMRVRSQTTGAALPHMNRVTTYTVKSKRVGPCKDGQIGGDAVLGGGVSVNLLSMAGKAPAPKAPTP